MENPIITLTTDFGSQDGYVGAMKGRILGICPSANLLDITHDIRPQNILQCSWTLLRATAAFPEGSIHVAVVDPGVGSKRRPVLIKSEGRWYVGPDNGVFSEIIREKGTEEVYEIKTDTEWWKAHSSFDGLALFAPAAAHLAKGLSPREFSSPITQLLTIIPKSIPKLESRMLRGEILMFDRFGNALTNISKTYLEKIPQSSRLVSCQQKTFQWVSHYEQGKDHPAIALINSDDYLELAVYSGSAEKAFDLKVGDSVTIR